MASEEALHERYAHHFPVRNHLIYLNHAAVAPLCKPAADAMKHLADDCCEFGSLHYQTSGSKHTTAYATRPRD